MSILSPEVEKLIQREMSAGQYASENELLLDALQELAERRVALEAVTESLTDIAQRRVKSARDFDKDFEARKGIRPS